MLGQLWGGGVRPVFIFLGVGSAKRGGWGLLLFLDVFWTSHMGRLKAGTIFFRGVGLVVRGGLRQVFFF